MCRVASMRRYSSMGVAKIGFGFFNVCRTNLRTYTPTQKQRLRLSTVTSICKFIDIAAAYDDLLIVIALPYGASPYSQSSELVPTRWVCGKH
jgi:hypothetical protein